MNHIIHSIILWRHQAVTIISYHTFTKKLINQKGLLDYCGIEYLPYLFAIDRETNIQSVIRQAGADSKSSTADRVIEIMLCYETFRY